MSLAFVSRRFANTLLSLSSWINYSKNNSLYIIKLLLVTIFCVPSEGVQKFSVVFPKFPVYLLCCLITPPPQQTPLTIFIAVYSQFILALLTLSLKMESVCYSESLVHNYDVYGASQLVQQIQYLQIFTITTDSFVNSFIEMTTGFDPKPGSSSDHNTRTVAKKNIFKKNIFSPLFWNCFYT